MRAARRFEGQLGLRIAVRGWLRSRLRSGDARREEFSAAGEGGIRRGGQQLNGIYFVKRKPVVLCAGKRLWSDSGNYRREPDPRGKTGRATPPAEEPAKG